MCGKGQIIFLILQICLIILYIYFRVQYIEVCCLNLLICIVSYNKEPRQIPLFLKTPFLSEINSNELKKAPHNETKPSNTVAANLIPN